MLNILTRKLCPLMSLAIFTIGCGKKINEPSSSLIIQTENQELPSAYVLKLDGSLSSKENYKLPGHAQFEIPSQIKVRSGLPYKKAVDIAFQVNEFDSSDFQFKCSYLPDSSEKEMVLTGCSDYDGNDFGDVNGHLFTLHFGDIIQVRFTGASASDLVVEAVFGMNWI